MTISIQGSWGSGKTSIMTMVQEKIKNKVIPVFFNTWQLSQLDMGNQLPISMMKIFLNKISGGNKSELSEKLRKWGLKGMQGLINAGVRTLSGGLLENPFVADDSKNGIDMADLIDNLHSSIQIAANECCKEAGKDRIVVFIDDLDRLVPSKAMELLEVLKIFFDCNKCVFVLAIDYDVVIRGAAEKYGFNLNDRSAQGLKEAEKGKAFF